MENQNVINYLDPILLHLNEYMEKDLLSEIKNQISVKNAYYFLLKILSNDEKKWLLSLGVDINKNIYVQNGNDETRKIKFSWTHIFSTRMS